MPDRSAVYRLRFTLLLLLAALATSLQAAPPRIAIIIDDLGYLRGAADRLAALDGPVAFAILPHTPHAQYTAMQARRAGKEILLHLPLQPTESVMPVGIGSISLDTTRRQLAGILDADFRSLPPVDGVNTHMGSLLTRHPGHMAWLMGELRARGQLFFVDSYTTPASVALQVAREQGLPATRRDVFLDNDPDPREIEAQFARLKHLARLHGSAVGIGHPYAETLLFLERVLPRLRDEGLDLVTVARVIELQQSTDEKRY